jgi:hypothetical protein
VSATSAFSFLLAASARNRLRAAFRRFRSPRHAVAMVLGGAWVAFILFQQLFVARTVGHVAGGWAPGRVAWFVELGMLAVVLLAVALTWLWKRGDALPFTDSEIQLLFPAPLTRRQLVNYKVVGNAIAGLVLVVSVVILFGRGDIVGRARGVLGGWMALTTLTLHGMGAGFTRATLAQHGLSGLRRRIITLAVGVSVIAAVVIGAWRAPGLDAFPDGPAGVEAWTRALASTAPLSWALHPFRASLDVAFGLRPLGHALPAAVAILALHYLWVVRSDAAFEDAAVAAARRAARQTLVLQRGISLGTRRRAWLRLAPTGRPELAFLWKEFVRKTRFISIQELMLGLLFVIFGIVGWAVGHQSGSSGVMGVLGLFCYALVLLWGPSMVSPGLRGDVGYLETIRSLPVRGRHVIVGELAMPVLALTLAQFALLVPVIFDPSPLVPAQASARAAVAAALAIVGPVLTAAALLGRGALVVIYPGWAGGQDTTPVSLPRTGVRVAGFIIGVGAQLAAALVVALAGGIVLAMLWPLFGFFAAPIGAFVGGAAAVGALAVAVVLLGAAFERIDPEP